MRDDLPALAAEAYGYGYPLLQDLRAVGTAGVFNAFVHQRTVPTGPNANPDLLCSTAQLDLSGGPMWLRVPATGGRYHVVQFVDAWTNDFAYVGSRSTPDEPREFLLVPPGWAGREAPAAEVIRVPTMIATLIARFAAGPGGQELQDQLQMQRLYPQVPLDGLPAPQPGVPDDLVFLETLRRSLAAFPPSPAERRYQRRFVPLGLFADGNSPYPTIPREHRLALRDGLDRGREALEEAATTAHAAPVNGWTNDRHAFDYNLDHFGVGTVDTPLWTLPDRESAHVARAVAARTRLWGSHAYEALQAAVHRDAGGARLSGDRAYTLRAPAGTLATYAAPSASLVGSVTSGGDTVRIQPGPPADGSPWLPAPPGEFHLVLRVYSPPEPLLRPEYELPPVVPV